jgi:hypothetical protein
MRKQLGTVITLVALTLTAMALMACSGTSGQEGISGTAGAASTPGPIGHGASGPPNKGKAAAPGTSSLTASGTTPAAASSSSQRYLYNLMREPRFAEAFSAMQGTDQLPDWVRQGGTATPAKSVNVAGKSYLLARACKPHDCPSEMVALLYDKADHTMQGVFVRDPSPGPDVGVSQDAEFTWLGKPSAAAKTWLKKLLRSPRADQTGAGAKQ